MTATLWQRIDKAGRNLAPGAVTVMLALIGMVPLGLPAYSQISPNLTLIAIYYWGVHRPDLLRMPLIFFIGLLQDLLVGGPFGLTVIQLILVYWLVLTQRRLFLSSSFSLLWLGFALIMAAASLLQWAVFSLMIGHLLAPQPVFFQGLMTLALFPLVGWFLIRVHRAFLQA